MKTLFAPAIALLNRVGYPRKFAIMGVLALVASAVLVVEPLPEPAPGDRQFAAGTRRVAVIKPIARLVQHLQVHRGLSSGVLNGNEAMQEARAARQGR
jgi:methyl-accepting chemotaxis protein